MPRLGPN